MDLSNLIMSGMSIVALALVIILVFFLVSDGIGNARLYVQNRKRKESKQLASLETRQWILEMRIMDLEMEQYHRRGKRRGGRR